MRIALISPPFESVPPKLYGGTERVVASLARGLIEQDVEVTLFASGDSITEAKLVPVVPQGLRLKRPSFLDAGPYQLRMLTQIAAQAEDFDLIHNHNDYWMFPLSVLSRTPLLTTLHGRLDLPDVSYTYQSFPEQHWIAISDSQRSQVPHAPWLRTIHHGIALEDYVFQPQPGKYLAFLGRFSPEKGPEEAIAIAHQSGIPLKIAAKLEDGWMKQYFDARIAPQIDGRFIEYVGEISESEKSEFLGNARALVFPIDWPEPFGLVMIEALACGTPVLARPCGSVPEILRDGKTGFLSHQISDLARLARDGITQISRAFCRRHVEEHFSLRRMTEDYLHVYRSLLSAPRCESHRRNFLHSLERAPQRDPEARL